MWTSLVTGYDSIKNHVFFMQSPAGLDAAIASVAGDGAGVQTLIEEFLQGSGIPCPAKFNGIRGGFSSLINFDKIDTPGFRARAFTWAAKGSLTVSPEGKRIAVSPCAPSAYSEKYCLITGFSLQISAVPNNDQLYSDHNVCQMMLTNDKISFRTCMGYVCLPASYITTLISEPYPSPSSDGPANFEEAFNFWFLTEILTAIGGHNML